MFRGMYRGSGQGGGGEPVNYNRVVEKIAVIPSAETAVVSKVYMYMGESNATYTHGYIYECVATQTATAVSFSGNIVSNWAVADFVSYLQEGGAAYNEVTHGTLTYDATGNLWDLVGYDANGIQVMSFHEYTEDLEDFGCTFASSTHQDGDSCNFTLTTEESGKKWKQMDVQPSSGGGTVQSVNGKTGVVVLNATDVNALPDSTKYVASATWSIDSSTYIMTLQLKDQDGANIGSAQTIDLPLESVVVGGSYDNVNKQIVLTLQNGNTINVPVADLVSGLQETLVNQQNIKSVNGNSLLGSGNLELSTYLTYPSGWTVNSTTKAFCDDIAADTNAVAGKAYLGEVTLSDLPASMANAEVVVEIIKGTTSANKVVVLTCTSGNAAPYKWQYTYWNEGVNVSGWQTWATASQGAKADTAVQPADLATVATSGDYNDLTNKPTIPAAQVNADWNANSGVAQILNKPTLGSAAAASTSDFATATQGAKADTAVQPGDLATVATSGNYDDLSNKPTIPASQVNSDWNASSGVAQILNKPTLGTMAAESANDYTKTANLATVATTGAYSDLSGTPTIPTVNNATLTITQGGTTKGTFTANAGTDVTIDVDAGGSSLPSQTGQSGKFLTTDGTDASWGTPVVATFRVWGANE